MAPVLGARHDAVVYEINGVTRPLVSQRANLIRAVRRALMACARDATGRVELLFSGHGSDGSPGRSGRHDHVFLAAEDVDADGRLERVIVVAPWRADRTSRPQRQQAEWFESVTARLTTVRAGELGVISLSRPASPVPEDRVFRRSRTWISLVPYSVNRHPKRCGDLAQSVSSDLHLACMRRGLPRPSVQVLNVHKGSGHSGLYVNARLTFSVAVEGPLMLGQNSHAGGGLFVAEQMKEVS